MAGTDVVVRERGVGDLDACLRALRSVQETDGYPVVWPRDPLGWLTPAGVVGGWVAELDGVVVGQVLLGPAGEGLAADAGLPAAELVSVVRLFVGVAARGRGVARLLLARATEEAARLGRRPVLEVETRAEAAIALYERAGWKLVGTRVADWRRQDGSAAHVHTYLGPVAAD
ncbi:GCN5 family acetyltransferase [Kitasatospora sp. MMS16-BH015]|uniref:GNAT family N-acetyltransferase n=1 Tax=Kitasatospora sp. MMS16-BH015 TaxID=2018025 RepID=UPI000CA14267|nr:GNAT family N-acetyltransferase [Kitasatospora sp. MMS16-BH015]AUG77040.1 GCN5 family acetyltransferase [Kitasatospora sp. MMS16-BH015]